MLASIKIIAHDLLIIKILPEIRELSLYKLFHFSFRNCLRMTFENVDIESNQGYIRPIVVRFILPFINRREPMGEAKFYLSAMALIIIGIIELLSLGA